LGKREKGWGACLPGERGRRGGGNIYSPNFIQKEKRENRKRGRGGEDLRYSPLYLRKTSSRFLRELRRRRRKSV